MMGVGAENQSSPQPAAKQFGKYYLLERIGAGGMAEVFRAVAMGPEGFQRPLVIKRMLPHLSQDRAFVEMFIDEAKLCGVLSHPNLVQIFEFGSVGDSFFIAMEHVHGETLLAVEVKLAQAGRLAPVGASLEIVRQVCLGLHYAHSLQSSTGQPLGIVHRDVSPANLMLSFHGGVKILDFGIARVAEGVRETRTQAGTMKGKVSYMSPEQIRMEPIDGRSDVFAVGIVLHELLTGRRLFRSTNEYTRARMVLESEIPLPSTVNPAVTAAVDGIVMHALERNPRARYQDAGEMADDLEKALFEMRASPHEPRKLLASLFPHGPSRSGEVNLPATLGPWSSGGVSPAPSLPGIVGQETGAIVPSGAAIAGKARGRRSWVALLGVCAAVAAVVVVFPHWKVPPPDMNAAPATAQQAAAPAPQPTPPLAPPAPAAQRVVRISLDSSPQDAQVTREDSGEVVGRTPITIALPQGSDVISFVFEKSGYASASYKVIPDLDKAVRAELTAEPAAEPAAAPKHASTSPSRSSTSRGRHATSPDPKVADAAAAPQARDCSLSVASFPWSELWIDGKDTGQRTPVVRFPVTCGEHKIALRRRDLKIDRSEQVTLTPERELKRHYDFSDQYVE
jgi:serine/threonine protein kinase